MKHILILTLVILLGPSSSQSFAAFEGMSDTVYYQQEKGDLAGLDIEDDYDEPALFNLFSTETPQSFIASLNSVSYQLLLQYLSFQSRAPPTFLI